MLPDNTLIDDKKIYTVAVNSFLADGGDGFTMLCEGTNKYVGSIDLEALIEYIKALKQPFDAQFKKSGTL